MNRMIRIVIVVVVVGFLSALIFYNLSHPNTPDVIAWRTEMTKGNPKKAQQHLIMYTDLFCPYCNAFSRALTANLADFTKEYLDSNKLYFEIRMTAQNSLIGHSKNSAPAAEAAYCAANQNHFWDFYTVMLQKIYDDYYVKGIGVDRHAPKIPELDLTYFYDAAKRAKLDEAGFKTCFSEHQTKAEVDKNTQRAYQTRAGVPYFTTANQKYSISGFGGNWDLGHDYLRAKLILNAAVDAH